MNFDEEGVMKGVPSPKGSFTRSVNREFKSSRKIEGSKVSVTGREKVWKARESTQRQRDRREGSWQGSSLK